MKKQVEALLEKLHNNNDVRYLDVYTELRDPFWEFYYHATGYYKGFYFMIGMNKAKESDLELKIVEEVNINSENFKTFLSTITNLEFKIK